MRLHSAPSSQERITPGEEFAHRLSGIATPGPPALRLPLGRFGGQGSRDEPEVGGGVLEGIPGPPGVKRRGNENRRGPAAPAHQPRQVRGFSPGVPGVPQHQDVRRGDVLMQQGLPGCVACVHAPGYRNAAHHDLPCQPPAVEVRCLVFPPTARIAAQGDDHLGPGQGLLQDQPGGPGGEHRREQERDGEQSCRAEYKYFAPAGHGEKGIVYHLIGHSSFPEKRVAEAGR